MTVRRLAYIANARLPTEKAHGYQIAKMCEAFAQSGVKVTLMHPRRYQFDPTLRGQSVFDYYGIKPIFEVRSLPNLDVVPLDLCIPDRFFTPIFFTHALFWGRYAVLAARQERADLYYTREPSIAFWLVRSGLPTIYEAHVVPKRAQRWLLQRAARRPALRLVVALTSFIREQFVQMGFPAEKVVVQPDAVDLSLFEDLLSKEECRHRLGLPLDRPLIGYVGRFRTLEMEKGIPELIEATALLPFINGKEPLLLCVGGPMEVVPTYLGHARRLGVPEYRLKFVDRVPNTEVPYWMHACDVVTIPWPWTEFSAYFTSPMKLFEYMAAGVAMVASDLPSIREVLRHGENAWLVEPGSPKALAEGIGLLLTQQGVAERLGVLAQEEVRHFTWRSRVEMILRKLPGVV